MACCTAGPGADPKHRAASANRATRVVGAEPRLVRLDEDWNTGRWHLDLNKLFDACDGDLERMARELLGPHGAARQVHLRLNQLGLRLRDLRGARGARE